ncbi:TetR/AcrR family transcriptional regulator [Ewingella americana]|uniref:TetR/AcrR family transcriptional regulator n=1 Tax=Ewingella americana TaxID=41202 RepID=A0A502G8F3_9GAMM|nr:TetR/AcrR family transcriptional regulator [Ewingella americana]TPG58295.1 TetR/AcrR family transcriptional regulator [Ewingella americana]
MSSSENRKPVASSRPRVRLSREDRYQQLLRMAWAVIREEGTEALTLGYLAERSGVTKPVVYDHFGTRAGLLAVLYQDYDQRQTALMDAALEQSEETLAGKATVIASSYIDCVLSQGREIPGVIAALTGAPELEKIKRDYEATFVEKCRGILTPFSTGESIPSAGLWAMLGAAEALSSAAGRGEISAEEAKNELFDTIVSMVKRDKRRT